MSVEFKKITQANAAAIANLFELEEQGAALLDEQVTPQDFAQKLLEQEDYTDFVHFMAYALPKREATWWACLCARACLNDNSAPQELKAIELAETWVYKPLTENGKAAFQVAQQTEFKIPAAWAAAAAFWSCDNMSMIEDAVVPPADDLTPKAVVGAVMLSAVFEGADKIKERYQKFAAQAMDIACGGDGRKI